MKVGLFPKYNIAKDEGLGGIWQVYRNLHTYLPKLGVEIVTDVALADVVNVHADLYQPKDVPLCASSHGVYYEVEGSTWPAWAYQSNTKLIKMMRTADATSVPSAWVHQQFARGMRLDSHIIMHGVDTNEWQPSKTNFGYVGFFKNRADPVCSPLPLQILAKRCPDIKFLSTFSEPIANVTQIGRVTAKKAKELITGAGIYLATTRETGGISLMEAMSAGVPPLGYAWGVNNEIIQHKVNGYLVEPGDYNALEEGLHYCIAHREELGANARQTILDSFRVEERIKDYIPFFQEAIDNYHHVGPKISVIVTAYNLEKYLPACLESIERQDFNDYEVIIVDDASPDRCGEIADGFARHSNKYKVIHNTENVYLAEARNIGIRAARGKYILPLDADDELGDDTLRVLSEALDKDRDTDIVGGGFELIEPDGRRWVSTWPPKNPNATAQLAGRNQLMYSSMYRKQVWERVGGYKRRWKSAEDAACWAEMLSYGAVAAKVTENPTLVYNNRPSSMSHSQPTPDWLSWTVWSKLPEFTPFGLKTNEEENPTPALPYDPPVTTVIIPVGPNHEWYLQDAIDSVINQTLQNWRLIVVNDTGSRWFNADNSHRTPYTMGYPFVTWVDGNKSTGPAGARNRGLALVKTDNFVLLDADDYFQPLALDMMYKAWKELGGWIYTDWYDQHGQLKEAQTFNFQNALVKMVGPSTGMYPTQAVKDIGGFDENLRGWEDWDLMLSLMSKDICGTRLAAPCFTYRYHTGSRRDSNYNDAEKILEEIKTKHAKLLRGDC